MEILNPIMEIIFKIETLIGIDPENNKLDKVILLQVINYIKRKFKITDSVYKEYLVTNGCFGGNMVRIGSDPDSDVPSLPVLY